MQYESFANLFAAKSEKVWANEIFHLAKKLGFDQTLFAVIGSKTDPYDKAFLKSNYSPIWRATYDHRGLGYIDPTVIHSLKSMTPMVWTEESFIQPQQKEMYEEASLYGLQNGLVFPIHGPNGEFGVITFVSEGLSNPKDRDELLKAMPLLSVVRDYAFETSMRFLAAHVGNENITLTPREKEILKWTMVGKSMWEISKILNCSESTVNFHITNVRRKFGVTTKHHAILKAIKMKIIEP